MQLNTFRHGAHPERDGATRFSLWAPDAKQVAVETDDDTIHSLKAHPNGWFSSVIDCPSETTYRFVIDNELRVPDPASRVQVGDVHGWSCAIDHSAYCWRSNDWRGRPWHETVIYELHVGLLGGFASVQARLPSLVSLGVTAIELMPLAEFPGARNWGYDGALLFAPESSYGTPEELKSLVDTAHSLGLMVFLDVVYNHFGPDGNFIGQYASAFFRDDIQTPWGPAIDFRRREVRDFFCENALMWVLDYHIDGLRLDAVHAISEKDFLTELAERVRGVVAADRHVHLILENEENSARLLQQGFDAQWNDDGHNVLHHLLTGEHEGYYAEYAETPTNKLARCLSEGFIFQGENTRHGKSRGEPSAHLSPTAFVLFLQNHDQVGNRAFGERLLSLSDPDALKAAVALLLLCPMIPLLFMGEEWGSERPFLYFTDHNPELGKAVREGRQNEFSEFSLFADAGIRHKIPDPNALNTFISSIPDYTSHNISKHHQWRLYYQNLLKLRHTHIIPRLPDTRSAGVTLLAERALSATWSMGDGSSLRIDINLAATQVETSPRWNLDQIIFSNGVEQQELKQGILPPRSVVVLWGSH